MASRVDLAAGSYGEGIFHISILRVHRAKSAGTGPMLPHRWRLDPFELGRGLRVRRKHGRLLFTIAFISLGQQLLIVANFILVGCLRKLTLLLAQLFKIMQSVKHSCVHTSLIFCDALIATLSSVKFIKARAILTNGLQCCVNCHLVKVSTCHAVVVLF